MKLSRHVHPCMMGHPRLHVPHTYHMVLQKRFALLFTQRRPEPWLDSFG